MATLLKDLYATRSLLLRPTGGARGLVGPTLWVVGSPRPRVSPLDRLGEDGTVFPLPPGRGRVRGSRSTLPPVRGPGKGSPV